MTEASANLNARYDIAAPAWGDKMRTLGYYDAYLGFLSAPPTQTNRDVRVIDIGAGTASFAEAWVAIHGAPREMMLLDPSSKMLDRGRAALERRDVKPTLIHEPLGMSAIAAADIALAAHVIEHCADPLLALRQIHDVLCPGGKLHLVVSKPHWCNVIIWLQWRHRTFSEDEILNLLKQAGFEVERVYTFPSGPPSRTSRGLVARKPG